MSGSFETPASKLFCTIKEVCKKCNSTNIECLWRDMVWDETCYKCCDCNYEWVKQ